MNQIAARLRDYASQIDAGLLAPSKMLLLFDEPGIIAQVGFTDQGKLNTLSDAIAPLWREGIR